MRRNSLLIRLFSALSDERVEVRDIVLCAYEEDEDSDLLNNVVRYRTGYIRVIEEYAHGWLSEIYPTNAFDRWVEVYYGDELIFNGYIQRQDFSSELIPVPRVIELPVISPMGLFEQLTFSNTLYLPPTSATLGELLDQVLANTNYEYVYRPKRYGYPNTVSLSMSVSTLAVCPWDDEYHHSMNVSPTSKVMKGKTYYFLIEAICKAFGWICHDTPNALIFTAFDYEGVYREEAYTVEIDAATGMTISYVTYDESGKMTYSFERNDNRNNNIGNDQNIISNMNNNISQSRINSGIGQNMNGSGMNQGMGDNMSGSMINPNQEGDLKMSQMSHQDNMEEQDQGGEEEMINMDENEQENEQENEAENEHDENM